MINKIKYKGSSYYKQNNKWLKQYISNADGIILNEKISNLVQTMFKNELGIEIINEKLSKKLDKKLRKLKLKKIKI